MKVAVFSDGSCKPNPGLGGVGCVIVINDVEFKSNKIFIGNATNQIAELKAVDLALDTLLENNLQDEEIELMTDSQYAVGMFMKNWKAKANQQLISEIKTKLNLFPKLIISWVKGHDGNKWNERADVLANQAIDFNS
jgi:ribonuclease HI